MKNWLILFLFTFSDLAFSSCFHATFEGYVKMQGHGLGLIIAPKSRSEMKFRFKDSDLADDVSRFVNRKIKGKITYRSNETQWGEVLAFNQIELAIPDYLNAAKDSYLKDVEETSCQ